MTTEHTKRDLIVPTGHKENVNLNHSETPLYTQQRDKIWWWQEGRKTEPLRHCWWECSQLAFNQHFSFFLMWKNDLNAWSNM